MENINISLVIRKGFPGKTCKKIESRSLELNETLCEIESRSLELNETLRRSGKAYTGQETTKDGKIIKVKKSERKMGPPCESSMCASSRFRFCSLITEEQRKDLFDDFWKNLNWLEKQEYVVNMVKKVERKQVKSKNKPSRRNATLKYHFVVDGEVVQVCKKMFLGTLAIKEATVHYWLTHFPCGRLANKPHHQQFVHEEVIDEIEVYESVEQLSFDDT